MTTVSRFSRQNDAGLHALVFEKISHPYSFSSLNLKLSILKVTASTLCKGHSYFSSSLPNVYLEGPRFDSLSEKLELIKILRY